MDFVELEAIEGLRWSWNAWPTTKKEVTCLVIPLRIMCTPLMQSAELPILSYEPLTCTRCGAVLNPYSHVDYQSRIWGCPFCYQKNTFPISYSGIGETNFPAELFPTYSTVECKTDKTDAKVFSNSNLGYSWANGFSSSNTSFSSMGTPRMAGGGGEVRVMGPAFVFVVDACTAVEEQRAVKNELLLIIEPLPDNASVGLVGFDSMVRVYDLGFSECSGVVVFHGEREVYLEQINSYIVRL